MTHIELQDVFCKVLQYSKTHSYKTSTLQYDYPDKILDLGSAIAISMPGDEDRCAHYALCMMAVYWDDALDMEDSE